MVQLSKLFKKIIINTKYAHLNGLENNGSLNLWTLIIRGHPVQLKLVPTNSRSQF